MNIETVGKTMRNAPKWLTIWIGEVFACGILAVVLPLTFSFAIAIVIGCVVLVAGIAHLIFAFQTRGLGGFLGHILLCVIYEIAALSVLVNPLLSIISLTLILAVFLILEGILELALYFRMRAFSHSIWVLVDGIGTLICGFLLVRQWPPATPEVIGGLVGASLMLSAISRSILSLALRTLSPARLA